MNQKLVQESVPARLVLLLVADPQSSLLAYGAVLEPLGYDIVTATSGDEAVRLFAGRRFSPLLVDVRSPGVDGLATLDLLRTNSTERHR
jgi:CheY-like chemotaxis protein